jgi:hypothetical protein
MRIALAFAAVLLAGCNTFNQSAAAKVQDAANEMNLNTRFGRMEIAAESISPKAREQFFEHRRGWGGKVRIADYELAGVKITNKDEDDADIFVKVAWFNVSQGELRATTLKQKWHESKGAWMLVGEERLEGDLGLLGESVPIAPAPTEKKPSQFPTIHLGQGGPLDEEIPSQATAPAQTSSPAPTAEK